MLLKFIKIEFKRDTPNLNKINLRVRGKASNCSYTIKAPRKTRNNVVNFYGETIELSQIDTSFTIILQETSSGANIESSITILSVIQYECPTEIRNNHWKQQVEENHEIKFFWSHCSSEMVENRKMLSRKSSDLSMDLTQFDGEIPTLQSMIRENFKIYSPIGKKKRHRRISIRHPSIEEGIQSSPEDCSQISPEKKLLTKDQLIRRNKKQLFALNHEKSEVFLPEISKITAQTRDPGSSFSQAKPFQLKIQSVPKSPLSPYPSQKVKAYKQDKKYKITRIGCIYAVIIGAVVGMVSSSINY